MYLPSPTHMLLAATTLVLSSSPCDANLPTLPNLSNPLGTSTSIPAYERIITQPVFQVTTPWGSPYMLFEKYKDEEKALDLDGGGGKDSTSDVSKFSRAQQKDDMQDTRPISLYFLDEHDARALADQMKQMKHMKDSDLRITCTTLGKAVRQASHLGYGLPTGQGIEETTGTLPSMDEGGSLRHKLVPSKRELFYAARCVGRERVGCFGATPGEDAELLLQPEDVIEGQNMALRRKGGKGSGRAKKGGKEGEEESAESKLRREYAHMEGQVGLPVFYCEGLVKKPPLLRRLVQGKAAWNDSTSIPLYFSYEDLQRDYNKMRNKSANKNKIPAEMPKVEVFHALDVVASIDRDQWKMERRSELLKEQRKLLGHIPGFNFVSNIMQGKKVGGIKSGLEKVVFVPSSLGVQAKERISANGNRKSRLRPMRAWGKNA